MGFFDNPGQALETAFPILKMNNSLFQGFKKGGNPFSGMDAPKLQDIPQGAQEDKRTMELRGQLANMPGPKMLSQEESKSVGNSLPQFEAVRQSLRDEASQAKQQQNDAIKRRYASLGALNSGAAIKQEQLANESIDRNIQNQLRNLGAQEAAQLGQQQFSRDEAVAARNAQREIYNADKEFQDRVFRFDAGSKLSQLDLAFDQASLARAVAQNDKLINEFNGQLSLGQAKMPKKGLLGGISSDIFGDGGLF